EGDYILAASGVYAADIDPRLPANFVADQGTLLGTVRGNTSTQKFKTADLGNLTEDQSDALVQMNELVSRAKESAKLAYPGRTVMLRADFQVGITTPGDLASILHRARIVLAS